MSHIPNVPNDGFHGHDLREAQARWSRLTTSDFGRIASEADLIDAVQERYGLPRDVAAQDVAMWERNRRS